MGLGSMFSFMSKSKPKANNVPVVPNLNSKSSDIPVPNDPFSSQKQDFNDLPDFPDFPDFNTTKSDLFPVPTHGIESPRPIVSQNIRNNSENTQSGFDDFFAKKTNDIKPLNEKSKIENSSDNKKYDKEYKIDSNLNKYELSNSKFIGTHSLLDSENNHFVNIHDYKQTLEFIDSLRDNVSVFENSSMQLHDLSSSSANFEELFRKSIEDIQRRLIFIDKTIFETPVK